jgi:hypothetical protein
LVQWGVRPHLAKGFGDESTVDQRGVGHLEASFIDAAGFIDQNVQVECAIPPKSGASAPGCML